MTREQRELTENLQEKEKKFNLEKSKRIQSVVREAKNQVRQMIQEIKGGGDISKLRKTERQLETMGRIPLSAHRDDLSEWKISPEKLKEGDSVLIESYGAIGVLLEDPEGKKKVRVGLGNIETVIETNRLKGSLKKKSTGGKVSRKMSVNIHTESTSKAKTTCDLRGMNSDQALVTMEAFLSQAIVNGIRRATIIHGHGMGTVKRFVRDYLESCNIGSVIPGKREDGGDGVTIVEF